MAHWRVLPSGKRIAEASVTVNGIRRRKNFDRIGDARRWEATERERLTIGESVSASAGRDTIGTLFPTYLANPSWRETTRAWNKDLINAHIADDWGNVRFDRLTPELIQNWVNGLAASGLSARTIQATVKCFAGILDLATKGTNRHLTSNPARGLKLPKLTKARKRYLTMSEVFSFAEAAEATGPGMGRGDIILTLALTGIRIGELAALRASCVDLTRRRLLIRESVTEIHGRAVFGETKGAESRSVPFPELLTAYLHARVTVATRDGSDGLVFPATKGGVLRNRTMRRDWWNRAANASVGNLSPHELRHTAASLAVSAGASVLVVARMLGHANPTITLTVYADLFDTDLDTIGTRLNDLARAHFGRTPE